MAILWYIAGGYSARARMTASTAPPRCNGCSFEQTASSLISGRVLLAHHGQGGRELQTHALEDWMEKGYQAFGVMEKHLAANDSLPLVTTRIADIAL